MPSVTSSLLALLLMCGAGAGCAPVVKRDLSSVPAGSVGFDDLCGLQEFFDVLDSNNEKAPRMVSGLEPEVARRAQHRGGHARFAFETPLQLSTLRRVLDENWRRLPPQVATAARIDVEVEWSERAGVPRVVNDRDAELIIDKQSITLPTHVCLSELLFGAPLYRQRRAMLHPPADGRLPDGGAAD